MEDLTTITAHLQRLEPGSRQLEPLGNELAALTEQVVTYAHDFLNQAEQLPGYNSNSPTHRLQTMTVGEEGRPLAELLDIIRTEVDQPGINPASGRHLGYIPGGGIYPTALGDYLAAVTNQYAGVHFAGPGAVAIENQMIDWLNKLMGFPAAATGNLTSGGSIANLIAIVTARDAKGITSHRIADACIYLTAQVHHSVQKAIRIAGLGESRLRQVATDDRHKMDTAHLHTLIEQDRQQGLVPFLIVASAGTTDSGAIDPLADIAAIGRQHSLWLHVDAAYGGFFRLVDNLKDKMQGIEQADSITVDPHKGLFLAYGLGAVLIKDTRAMQRSHQYQANYMQDVEDGSSPSPADLSPELTKHFRGLRMWLSLHLFGLRPFRQALEEKYWLCRYFYHKVQELDFEVGPEPELSVCLYRYTKGLEEPNTFNLQLVKAIQLDGRIFVSSTTIGGIVWLRLAVLVFRTHRQIIDEYLAVLAHHRDALLAFLEQKP